MFEIITYINILKLDLYEFTVLLARAKKGNELSVFSNRTDEASAAQYFQVIYYLSKITNLLYLMYLFLFSFMDIFLNNKTCYKTIYEQVLIKRQCLLTP